ncbi:MAG: hypothetical protein RL748_89 [Pseudomonadota bacterium]
MQYRCLFQAIARLAGAIVCSTLASVTQAAASNSPLPRQDALQIQQLVQQFVQEQSSGMPGQVSFQVTAPDPRLNLAQCDQAQAFLPRGGRLWGKSTVGVRCSSPQNWTIYVQVQVQVLAEYVVTSGPLSAGQLLKPEHLSTIKGDLCSLPGGVLLDKTQALDKTVSFAMQAGVAIRLDQLRRPQIIQAGQLVKLQSVGNGFKISTEVRAIGSASEGQVIQVKTANGQQISAIARAAGMVEVAN